MDERPRLQRVLLAFCSFGWAVLVCAFTTKHLWDWFIAPLGVPQVNYAHAFGIAIVISYLTDRVRREEDDVPTVSHFLVHVTTTAAWSLLLGWLLSGFVR